MVALLISARAAAAVCRAARVSLRTRNASTSCSILSAAPELVLLGLEVGVAGLEVGGGLLERDLAGQDRAGLVVVAVGDGLPRLVVELGGLLTQCGELELDPLAARGHVGDPAAYLLQQGRLRAIGLVELVLEAPRHRRRGNATNGRSCAMRLPMLMLVTAYGVGCRAW